MSLCFNNIWSFNYLQETQIFKAYVPWEEEQGFGQSKPQVLCFVTRFTRNEFISSDAMSKLRQVILLIMTSMVWSLHLTYTVSIYHHYDKLDTALKKDLYYINTFYFKRKLSLINKSLMVFPTYVGFQCQLNRSSQYIFV